MALSEDKLRWLTSWFTGAVAILNLAGGLALATGMKTEFFIVSYTLEIAHT